MKSKGIRRIIKDGMKREDLLLYEVVPGLAVFRVPWSPGQNLPNSCSLLRPSTIRWGSKLGCWGVIHMFTGEMIGGRSFKRKKDAVRFATIIQDALDWSIDLPYWTDKDNKQFIYKFLGIRQVAAFVANNKPDSDIAEWFMSRGSNEPTKISAYVGGSVGSFNKCITGKISKAK